MVDADSLGQNVFAWNTALSLALSSDLAYQPPQAVINVVERNWRLDKCVFLEESDTECFVAGTNAAILVAFRGTESLNDWLADLDVRPTDKPYGRVHRGFVDAYEVVAPKLVDAIAAFQPALKTIHFTGHSLGGALATIAACELRDRFPIAAVYTFGQPRLGDRTTAEFIGAHYAGRFHRFVFDDDVVTRIPPGYRHVGRLLHFDSDGFLQQAVPEGGDGTTELPELSELQFKILKETAQSIRIEARIAVGPTEAAAELSDRSIEGLFPSVRDHRMSNYLFAIRNQIPRATEHLQEAVVFRSIELEAATMSIDEPRAAQEKFPVQVRVRDRQWRPPASADVTSKIGPIYSLQATKHDIATMQHDPLIFSLELGRDMDFPHTQECAVSVPFVKGDVVHSGNPGERGDQAIVALIDSGIDILHESFLDAGGMSRIEAVWVQRDNSGRTPRQVDPNAFQQDFGTLYTAQDIQTFVNNDLVVGNNTTPAVLRDPGPSVAQDHGHGTHVASIAAGRAVGTFAGGMAPESRIVVVVPHMKTTPPDPPSLGYSNSHQAALEFLMAYKKVRGLPMAVNVSLGMNAGAHDGMSTLEKAFDSITLKGKERGFIIVKSAGNERGHAGHAQLQASVAGVLTIQWDSRNVDRNQDYLEFWYDKDDDLTFNLVDPSGARSLPVKHALGDHIRSFSNKGNDMHLNLTVHHTDNDDNLLTVRIVPVQNRIQAGIWTLEVLADSLGPKNGIVNGWVERNDDRPVRFLPANSSDDMTLSIPGTADTVVSVAATNTSTPLRLQARSSLGPTRKDGPKPDLSAPGDGITAARSNSVDHAAVVPLSGTSMAAPHVTGALALVLSARHKKEKADPNKRQFNAVNLAGMLKRSAMNYNKLHNKAYGYGSLNAAAFFAEADLV